MLNILIIGLFLFFSVMALGVALCGYLMMTKADGFAQISIKFWKSIGLKYTPAKQKQGLKTGALTAKINGFMLFIFGFVFEGILFYYLIYKTLLA